MATTVEARIAQALFARLAALELTPPLPVAWPNVEYGTPAGGKFLAVSFIPNGAARQHIGSDTAHRFVGILQVSVFWPQSAGVIQPLEVAGKVADHFPPDLRLIADGIDVRIPKRPDVAGAIIEDARVQVPVSVEYEAYS